jgi:glycosyltransferase involved in cell wall biosynthesis
VQERVRVVSPRVDYVFELGTPEYRARVYARAGRVGIPAGVPLIVSDDPDVWRAAALVADRNPFIGVMHADDEAYYRLAREYQSVLSALVCVSSRIERTTRSQLDANRELPIHTIPCGIPLSAWTPSSLEPDTARITWVGRIEERQKRVSDLVRILVRARSEGIAVTLDVLGEGPERASLEQAAIDAGVDSLISFHGWQPVDRVTELLRDSDVFLLTSNFEGMPVAVMEALASGCPVVSSRVSGIEDYAERSLAQGALETFPVGDVRQAVGRLQTILSVPKRVRQERARKLAEAEFAIGVCMTRYEAALSRGFEQNGSTVSLAPRTFVGSYVAASIIASARHARFRFRSVREKSGAAV